MSEDKDFKHLKKIRGRSDYLTPPSIIVWYILEGALSFENNTPLINLHNSIAFSIREDTKLTRMDPSYLARISNTKRSTYTPSFPQIIS